MGKKIKKGKKGEHS
jgi:pescadillo protein